MQAFVCKKCRYIDILEENDRKCQRCGGEYIPLDLSTSELNRLSKEQIEELIDSKLGMDHDIADVSETDRSRNRLDSETSTNSDISSRTPERSYINSKQEQDTEYRVQKSAPAVHRTKTITANDGYTSTVADDKPKSGRTLKIILIVWAIVLIVGITIVALFKFVIHPDNKSPETTTPQKSEKSTSETSDNWIENADKSVLYIQCYDSVDKLICTGSGFLLYDDKTVITNYHVISGASTVKVITNTKKEFTVDKVRQYDIDADLSILTLSSNTGLNPLIAGDTSFLKKGDEVVAIGSPEGLQNSVSKGVFSARTDGMLQFTAQISHGSSGGALFNASGEVIGVTSGSIESGQGLNFAVPIETVGNLYTQKANNKTVDDVSAENIPFKKEIDEAVKEFGDYTTVDFSELMADVDKHNDQIIMTAGYVSSVYGKDVFLCPTAEEVRKTPEQDWFDAALFGNIGGKHYLEICQLNKANDETPKEGDYIIVLGYYKTEWIKPRIVNMLMIGNDYCINGGKASVHDYLDGKLHLSNKPGDYDECLVSEQGTFYHKARWCISDTELGYDDIGENPLTITVNEAMDYGYVPCPYCYDY